MLRDAKQLKVLHQSALEKSIRVGLHKNISRASLTSIQYQAMTDGFGEITLSKISNVLRKDLGLSYRKVRLISERANHPTVKIVRL